MSEKERLRKGVFEVVRAGAWSLAEAAEHLKMSYRQCKRSYQRYVTEGDAGLVHRSRGRRSNRRKDDGLREAVLQRYEERYEGFGPTLAAEKLAEDGYEVDHETLRRWLMAEGKWQRQRKRYPFRQRRERRLHFGELVQMDGSIHHWFGEELPLSCLVELIDDATGIRQGHIWPRGRRQRRACGRYGNGSSGTGYLRRCTLTRKMCLSPTGNQRWRSNWLGKSR